MKRAFVRLIATAVAACAVILPLAAFADGGWSCNTIRILVPYAAGGGTDIVARIVASKLGEDLHNTVIVDNRPGGKSIIAYQELLRARADGCTLLLDNSSHSIQSVYRDLPYDPQRDFQAVSEVALGPTLLATSTSFPASNLKEFVGQAKKGDVKYGSYGVGTSSHLDGETLSVDASASMTHVPYRGSAPALNDLVGGHIQALFVDGLAARPLLKAGKIRAIAAVGQVRWKAFPDVPTFGELGYADLSSPGWWGIFTGAKVPAAYVNQISDTLKKIVAEPDTVQKMWEIGAEAYTNGPAAFTSVTATESARWQAIVAKRHIVLE
ncbi:Bug family tripartite tricarboxylate transporter substrate binding protein [Paraburkholderia sp. ZP32-5]|uniref:Bug family tripartite tricarboxylate transporter substrate binding protein n=1 Tax=Paraburkholderia sp. ZP32-5 TaxID=2883245 RepID=UPI001F442FF3|nr:tripartite tricarboxylate transporter substrate-binding protein [Paraburkholderia sp. ZP32-5]